jgi:hypothetical protein
MSPGQTTRNEKTYRYYRCQNRHCTASARVSADKLETFIGSAMCEVLRLFSERGLVTTGRDVDVETIAALEQAISDAKERVRQAALVLDVNDEKDTETLNALAADVEAAKAALTDALGSQARQVTPDEWLSGWPTWSLDEKRTVLRELHTQVVVAHENDVLSGDGITLNIGDDTEGWNTSVTCGGS